MGYIRHHAILVSSWDISRIEPAHQKAVEIFGESVTPIVKSQINGYVTFCVGPDGSKEGWSESDAGDARREAFVAWMDAQRHEDHSSWLSWAEVQYGDDEGEALIVRHTDGAASSSPEPTDPR